MLSNATLRLLTTKTAILSESIVHWNVTLNSPFVWSFFFVESFNKEKLFYVNTDDYYVLESCRQSDNETKGNCKRISRPSNSAVTHFYYSAVVKLSKEHYSNITECPLDGSLLIFSEVSVGLSLFFV